MKSTLILMRRAGPAPLDRRRFSGTLILVVGVLALLAGWCLVAWELTGNAALSRMHALITRERTEAEYEAEILASHSRVSFARIRTIPLILASKESLIDRLAEFGPDARPSPLPMAERNRLWRADPALAVLAGELHALITRADLGAKGIWVMNAAGDTIAIALPSAGIDYTGSNYSEREYFQAARAGRNGQQFAIGKVGGVPGFFFASPVFLEGRFVGAIGARVDLADLTQGFGPGAFLTDAFGVVIYARDPDVMMKQLPDARTRDLTPEQRLGRYRRTTFAPLDLTPSREFPDAGVYDRPGSPSPWIWARREGDLVTVHVLRELKTLAAIRSDRLFSFGLQGLAGAALILAAVASVLYVRANQRHARDLARQAATDALTGCANRRFFLSMLQNECGRAVRYGQGFCVLALDLDHFKDVNDRFGHPGGDLALRRFTEVTRATLRATDLLGRLGGEEFAVLMPNTPPAEAAPVAERLRAAVAAMTVDFNGAVFSITVSIGVACRAASGTDSFEDVLIRADQALYRAKQAGRNRVEACPSCQGGPPPPAQEGTPRQGLSMAAPFPSRPG
ncbi:sensor domain-containing diguanylate cyclase [Pararhodospirillum oryzae]|uniref:diguanylate cyclase n=1 Tax=Pararhodospirillum oryzae TaxID=478448 RepID=A0A512HBC5_9PROT|nr:sensor domain-containing diguanylate cyclase [Pararhodospirillum oryzae]GEO82749.1 hypothetical protein ROR02_28800 [Pararhodospirillum oryzae]